MATTSISHEPQDTGGIWIASAIVTQDTKNAIFPARMVPSSITIAIALRQYLCFDSTHLSFNEGAFILVLARDTSGYWDGWSQGKRGLFPGNLVVGLVDTGSTDPLIHIANTSQQPDLLIELAERVAKNLKTVCIDLEVAWYAVLRQSNHMIKEKNAAMWCNPVQVQLHFCFWVD
jgi:hypothetical protein